MEPECKENGQKLNDHIKEDEKLFGAISQDLHEIKANHLAHIEPDVAEIKGRLGILQWLVFAVIGGIIAVYFHH